MSAARNGVPPGRLEDLQRKLQARTTDGGRTPKPGFKKNVRQLRAEIARVQQLEALRGQAVSKSAPGHPAV